MNLNHRLKLIAAAGGLLGFGGCASMGAPFTFQGPKTIVPGTTTKAEITARYGQPFRVGYENGDEKWTYGYYRYRLFGDSQTKDLAITFKGGVVSHYDYSSSDPDEVAKASAAR